MCGSEVSEETEEEKKRHGKFLKNMKTLWDAIIILNILLKIQEKWIKMGYEGQK